MSNNCQHPAENYSVMDYFTVTDKEDKETVTDLSKSAFGESDANFYTSIASFHTSFHIANAVGGQTNGVSKSKLRQKH